MRGSKDCRKSQRLQQPTVCRALCCSCRFSVSASSEEAAGSSGSGRFVPISSLAHAMVQERLDQMIRERREEDRRQEARMKQRRDHHQSSKFIVMVAMEKCSYDPREDFRESMVEMIRKSQMEDSRDLRCLLNCYMSMNSDEYWGVILEVFHEVCSEILICCTCRGY